MSILTTLLEDAGVGVPRPGWPGRRRAIARAWLRLVVQAVLFIVLMAAIYSAVVLTAAAMDVL